jgi:hypothetical protein
MRSPGICPAQFNLTHPKVRPILTYRKDEAKVSFSRQLVSVIAASVLVVHVVAGCCAHHEHLQAGRGESAIIGQHGHQDHDSSHTCHHHLANPTAPQDGEEPCEHSCGDVSCSFLAGSKIILPDLAEPAGIFTASSTVSLNQMAQGSLSIEQLPDGVILPPVRSHLSKCVLLL